MNARYVAVVVVGGVLGLLACGPGDSKPFPGFCPVGQRLELWENVPDQAPLWVPGNWSPLGNQLACHAAGVQPNMRYRFESGGTVNYATGAWWLTFNPDGSGKIATSPPFVKTVGKTNEFSLLYRVGDAGNWRMAGTYFPTGPNVITWWEPWVDAPRTLCFAPNDLPSGYGDNSGHYEVYIREQRWNPHCVPSPVGGTQIPGGGTPACVPDSACSVPDQKGVCASGKTQCAADGTKKCSQTVQPTDDANCNGVDEDCDGVADDGYASKECVRADLPFCQPTFEAKGRTECKAGSVSCVAVAGTDYCDKCTSGIPGRGQLNCGTCGATPCIPGQTKCTPGFVCKAGSTTGCGTPDSSTQCWPISAAHCQGCPGIKCWMPGQLQVNGLCPPP